MPRAFSEGKASEADYARLLRVRSPCVVFDSEVLHRGAATGGVSLATAALSPATTTPSPAITTTPSPAITTHHHPASLPPPSQTGAWGSTCTAQLCSASGWPVRHSNPTPTPTPTPPPTPEQVRYLQRQRIESAANHDDKMRQLLADNRLG